MVASQRGRVPARRARSRAFRLAAANPATAGRSGPGAASIRRCRRPAARRAGSPDGSASPRATKKPSSTRANVPGELPRPSRIDRSSSDEGWAGPPSASSLPRLLTRRQARAGQKPAATWAAKSRSQPGGSSRPAIRVSARTNGRPGCRCQQRPHKPKAACRRTWPHSAHARGGFFGGPGREQLPQQPVSSRRYPGLPQRGHGRLACSRSCRRWQRWQRIRPFSRTVAPQSGQVREHGAHLPVPGCRIRLLPQPGQAALALPALSRLWQRQQSARSR
jgi:hypothetical protein